MMMEESISTSKRKRKLWSILFLIYKKLTQNVSYAYIQTKKTKTLKFLKENTGEYRYDNRLVKHYLDEIPKAQSIKKYIGLHQNYTLLFKETEKAIHILEENIYKVYIR